MTDPTDPNDDNVEHDVQIVQLVPANEDWVALFEDGSGDQPVACFALMECSTHGNRYVAPIISDGGEMVDATQIDDYVGVLHVDQIADEPLGSEGQGEAPGSDDQNTH